MAVDTRDKRLSMVGLDAEQSEEQNPSGTVGAAARAMLLGLYAGLSAASTTTDPYYWRGALWVGQPKIAWPIDGALR